MKTYLEYLTESNLNDKFWKWFGESKIKSSRNNNPLVVYHGGDTKRIKSFTMTRDIGFHFAIDPTLSRKFSQKSYDDDDNEYIQEPLGCYIKIENLIDIEDMDLWRQSDLDKAVDDYNYMANHRGDSQINPKDYKTHNLLNNFKKYAYDTCDYKESLNFSYEDIDGFVYQNQFERGKKSNQCFIVFTPTQIKSIDNEGTWNPNDPNIYK